MPDSRQSRITALGRGQTFGVPKRPRSSALIHPVRRSGENGAGRRVEIASIP